jgi:Flp pilus assembly pilin Flp
MRRNSPTRSIHDRGYRMQDLTLKLYLAAKFVLDRTEGQSMTEYAMAVGLIAFGCIAGEAAIATNVNHVFVALATTITNGVILR